MTGPSEESRRAWEIAGAHEVAPGVHRIPLPLPGDVLRAVNVYVLEDDDGLTLIDAGQSLPQARQQLRAGLNELGADFGDVRRFLVTHVHRDHYTQAIALRREFGTRVSLGRDEGPSLVRLRDPSLRPFQAQLEILESCGAEALLRRIANEPLDERVGDLWEDPDDWLDEESGPLGSRRLRTIPTPGHTRGHVAFVDAAAGLFFTGDHVLPHITPSIGFEPVATDLPLGSYLQSLRRVREMVDATLLPAHGPVGPSVHARVDELIAHHDDRLTATMHAVHEGRHTPADVAEGLRWTRRQRELDELDPVNQLLAILECKAHLDLLVVRERLRRRQDHGVWLYHQTG